MDDLLGIRVKRFRDETLVDLRSVSVGRVDQRNAELKNALEHTLCLRGIGRLAPDARTAEPHGAEAKPMHGHVAADNDGAAETVGACFVIGHRRLSAH